VTLYGSGTQTRAFCYVDDLIDGLIRMMATGDDILGPVNLGNPLEIPVRTLAERIIALTGSRSRLVHHPLPQDDPCRRCPDINLATRLLGWRPSVGLEDGLARTIAYFSTLVGATARPRDTMTEAAD
jgi:UDP-glucuronate decarboxylase